MAEFCIKILDKDMHIKAENAGSKEVGLVYSQAYQEGDSILFETDKKPIYVWLQLDDALGKSLVYITGTVTYHIPFGESRTNLSPKVFSGEKHLLAVKEANTYEIEAYRNLALNVCDQHHIENMYPHAVANVETRNEMVFAAQNAIDGVTVNESHGEWPYESWGINRQEDAKIRIDFGRLVTVDSIVLYTRRFPA